METKPAGLTLISAWIGDYAHYKMLDEITHPFPNLNGAVVELLDWISNFIPLYCACDYLSMLGLKLFHVSERSP